MDERSVTERQLHIKRTKPVEHHCGSGLTALGHSAPDRMGQLYARGEELGRWRVARN